MDSASFDESICEFLFFLVSNITSHHKLEVSNHYLRNSGRSKFAYIQLQHNGQPLEMTVSFDPCYRVPVLHFRENYSVAPVNKYVMMDMHPILHTPYMAVHPCETESTMATTGLAGVEYLKLWFTMSVALFAPELSLRGAHLDLNS